MIEPANGMAATEAADSSTVNEGEQNASTGDTGAKTIPYSRFSSVVSERNEARAKAEAYEKQLAELTQKAQPQNVAKTENAKRFKDSYGTIDEFYNDVISSAADDDIFLEKVLNNLYEKKGEKFDETLFNALTRKQQKVTKESEEIQQKMVEENDQKLDRIEDSFGTDTTGFEGFKTWVTETISKENVPSWAKDLDSLYDVYKEYIYQKPTTSASAPKISRSRVSGKATPKLDLSGDFHDVLRRTIV